MKTWWQFSRTDEKNQDTDTSIPSRINKDDQLLQPHCCQASGATAAQEVPGPRFSMCSSGAGPGTGLPFWDRLPFPPPPMKAGRGGTKLCCGWLLLLSRRHSSPFRGLQTNLFGSHGALRVSCCCQTHMTELHRSLMSSFP